MQATTIGSSAAQRATWNDAAIERYSLTYTSVCGENGWYTVAPVRVELNSGQVEILGGPNPREIATVDRLFDLIDEIQADDTAQVLVEYGEYGQPMKIAIDYNESAVDDDLCIEVSAFEALDEFIGVVDGPVLSVTGPRGDSEAAMIQGLLALEDGCLYVRNEEWGPSALLWPFGTTWDAETQEVVGLDGSRATVGERLVTGGGYGTAEHYQEQRRLIGEGLAEAAVACTAGEINTIALVSNAFFTE